MGNNETYQYNPNGNILIGSVPVPDSESVSDAFLMSVIGVTSLTGMTLAQILSTFNLHPITAEGVDRITSYRIRQLVINVDSLDDLIIQIETQIRTLRQWLWAHEIRMQNLEYKAGVILNAPTPTDLTSAQSQSVTSMSFNTTLEQIVAEGATYKTANNLAATVI